MGRPSPASNPQRQIRQSRRRKRHRLRPHCRHLAAQQTIRERLPTSQTRNSSLAVHAHPTRCLPKRLKPSHALCCRRLVQGHGATVRLISRPRRHASTQLTLCHSSRYYHARRSIDLSWSMNGAVVAASLWLRQWRRRRPRRRRPLAALLRPKAVVVVMLMAVRLPTLRPSLCLLCGASLASHSSTRMHHHGNRRARPVALRPRLQRRQATAAFHAGRREERPVEAILQARLMGRTHAHAYLWNRRHASAQSQKAAVLLRRVKVLGGKVPAASQRRLVWRRAMATRSAATVAVAAAASRWRR